MNLLRLFHFFLVFYKFVRFNLISLLSFFSSKHKVVSFLFSMPRKGINNHRIQFWKQWSISKRIELKMLETNIEICFYLEFRKVLEKTMEYLLSNIKQILFTFSKNLFLKCFASLCFLYSCTVLTKPLHSL